MYTANSIRAMQAGERLELLEFSEYIIQNESDDDLVITLNVEASEAGEKISILLAEQHEQNLSAISTPKSWEGKARSVIGNTAKSIIEEEEQKYE